MRKSQVIMIKPSSMSYRKVVWEHTAAGTSGSDDWREGKA